MIGFALGSAFDRARLAALFATHRRMQIADFLTAPSAAALLAELSQSSAWKLTANRGEQIIDFDAAMLEAFTPEQWAKLDQAVALGGRYGFQFRYDTIRLPKDWATGAGWLAGLKIAVDESWGWTIHNGFTLFIFGGVVKAVIGAIALPSAWHLVRRFEKR